MTALSREDFQFMILNNGISEDNVASWSISAASTIATASIAHENFTKDEIVEALQALSFRMPPELVVASVENLRAGIEQVKEENDEG